LTNTGLFEPEFLEEIAGVKEKQIKPIRAKLILNLLIRKVLGHNGIVFR
jgi:hypothetical protein